MSELIMTRGVVGEFHVLALYAGGRVFHEEDLARWAAGDLSGLDASPAEIIPALALALQQFLAGDWRGFKAPLTPGEMGLRLEEGAQGTATGLTIASRWEP